MNDSKQIKTLTEELAEIVTSRIIEISESEIHPNKKSSELKKVALDCADILRDKVKSLNTLNNCFNFMRKSISGLGIPNHLLRNKIDEIDKSYISIFKVNDLYRSCNGDLSLFDKRLKQKINELISQSAEKYKDGDLKQAKILTERSEKLVSLRVFPESWYVFRLSDSERKIVETESSENREGKLRNKVSIGINTYLELAERLMRDSHYIKRGLGLAMLSGRRMSEIFVSANFEVITDDRISITGIIKKTLTDGNIASTEMYDIPCFIDAETFVHYFKKFRNDERIIELKRKCEKDGSFSPVNKTVGTMANYTARNQLKLLDKERRWTFSDTRAMAVAVAWYIDSKKDKKHRTEDEVIFYKDYLCHDDVETMLNYREFFVIPDDEERKTLLDMLHDAEEDVLRYSARSEITTDRILKVHDALCDYVSSNPNVKINKNLLKKQKKAGGIGAAHDVAVEYFEMIKPHITQ